MAGVPGEQAEPTRRHPVAATMARAYRSVQQFFKWLVDEEEIAVDPFAEMRPPAVPDQPVPIITDAELQRLVDTCRGNTFEARLHNAIIRLLLDTGIRAGVALVWARADAVGPRRSG